MSFKAEGDDDKISFPPLLKQFLFRDAGRALSSVLALTQVPIELSCELSSSEMSRCLYLTFVSPRRALHNAVVLSAPLGGRLLELLRRNDWVEYARQRHSLLQLSEKCTELT